MILDGQPAARLRQRVHETALRIVRHRPWAPHRDWLGLASIWTRADHRRRGWSRKLMIALGHWAARRGARNVYLQVAAPTPRRSRAYEAMGFRPHHRYGYLACSEPASAWPERSDGESDADDLAGGLVAPEELLGLDDLVVVDRTAARS